MSSCSLPLCCCGCLSCFFVTPPQPPSSSLFPYTTLFRSICTPRGPSPPSVPTADGHRAGPLSPTARRPGPPGPGCLPGLPAGRREPRASPPGRSEEHTSELQSRGHLVCRLLLEKKKELM